MVFFLFFFLFFFCFILWMRLILRVIGSYKHSLLCYADWSNNSCLYALDSVWASLPPTQTNKWYGSIRCLKCPLWICWIIVNILQNISNVLFKYPLLHKVRPGCIFVSHRSIQIWLIHFCSAFANIAGMFKFSFLCHFLNAVFFFFPSFPNIVYFMF